MLYVHVKLVSAAKSPTCMGERLPCRDNLDVRQAYISSHSADTTRWDRAVPFALHRNLTFILAGVRADCPSLNAAFWKDSLLLIQSLILQISGYPHLTFIHQSKSNLKLDKYLGHPLEEDLWLKHQERACAAVGWPKPSSVLPK